ncbi:relaxase/mobilization nuclease domain-containing protein [Nocardiopsis sp. NPDC058631]|uniref:relaxase/mobilization nuclease domain-containing protein n=1 Tax=Nocardiopsis sp. NPDC058631 TaxID=3346566 RepID=UPI003667510D
MIAKVMRGQDTLGLLKYLYGPGSANEHTDPHQVGAWRTLGVPDPGRTPAADLGVLARRLDRFVRPQVRRHVWHCAIRVAPTDRPLTDPEWEQVARRLASAGGVAPLGDERACRWVAVRHDGGESHHIHLLATLARQDDTNPDIHNDALRLRQECRRLEDELGLRPTSASDNTSAPSPTRGETEKALRQGRERPSRAVLECLARRAAAAARTEEEFFAALGEGGALLRPRESAAGAVTGYALALPGDVAPDGQPVWFSGGSLAPDLSLPRVRARFADVPPVPAPVPGGGPWAGLTRAVRAQGELWGPWGAGARAAGVAALSDALTLAAAAAPEPVAGVLEAAERDWSHAGRPPVRAAATVAAARLREAARALAAADPQALRDEDACLEAVRQMAVMAAQVAHWYRDRDWAPQERAAELARKHLVEVGGEGAGEDNTLTLTV